MVEVVGTIQKITWDHGGAYVFFLPCFVLHEYCHYNIRGWCKRRRKLLDHQKVRMRETEEAVRTLC